MSIAVIVLKVLVDDFEQPNGLCLSPDEKKLYIARIQAEKILCDDEVFYIDFHYSGIDEEYQIKEIEIEEYVEREEKRNYNAEENDGEEEEELGK